MATLIICSGVPGLCSLLVETSEKDHRNRSNTSIGIHASDLSSEAVTKSERVTNEGHSVQTVMRAQMEHHQQVAPPFAPKVRKDMNACPIMSSTEDPSYEARSRGRG